MLESYILRPHLVQLRKMQILDHHLHYFHRVGRGFWVLCEGPRVAFFHIGLGWVLKYFILRFENFHHQIWYPFQVTEWKWQIFVECTPSLRWHYHRYKYRTRGLARSAQQSLWLSRVLRYGSRLADSIPSLRLNRYVLRNWSSLVLKICQFETEKSLRKI